MKLDATVFRYITKDEFRVLIAVEMGMRNHEIVPVTLIESIAKVTRGMTFKIIQTLLRHKLVAHDGGKNEGYRLSYHGLDFLALRTLVSRGIITGVGRRIGVGKESDVHQAIGPNGEIYALKIHRLGRISFRAVKQKRDYLQHRQSASWMYMARLAAVKEYAYMKVLKEEGFPVPTPFDQNRHMILMSFIDAIPMVRIRTLRDPESVLERLMRLLVRLARAGIVHGDFNEFNLMVSKPEEKVTLIDFPQIIHLSHLNARETFDRDVLSIREYFRRKMGITVTDWPKFDEVLAEVNADGEGPLASLTIAGLSKEDDAMLVSAHAQGDGKRGRGGEDEDDERDPNEDSEDSDSEVENAEERDKLAKGDAATDAAKAAQAKVADGASGFEQLMPEGGAEPFAEDELDAALFTPPPRSAAAAGEEDKQDGNAKEGEDAAEEGEDDEGSESEDESAPNQVAINPNKKVRKKQTAKDARTNLQKQQKTKPARSNNQKAAQTRKAKSEIKEYFA